jgi:TetR/AcrR family transcriptional regulator, transcriptional repressor for nem operon
VKNAEMVHERRLSLGSSDTSQRILDIAERLVQQRGFNGFSYADISAELGITKPSIHHHFPSKGDLGVALVERYHRVFFGALAKIDETIDPSRGKLDAYGKLYASVLANDNRMCLCGMLAADFNTLPEEMRSALTAFFDANEAWLSRVLEEGRERGELRFDADAHTTACLLVSSLEGAMLVARSYCDPGRFSAVADRLLRGLVSEAPPKRKARAKPAAAGKRRRPT